MHDHASPAKKGTYLIPDQGTSKGHGTSGISNGGGVGRRGGVRRGLTSGPDMARVTNVLLQVCLIQVGWEEGALEIDAVLHSGVSPAE